MPTFDMIVIGSGPAGQRAAIQGAKLGKRVVLIEKLATLGGCCINTGTIPSKTMREAVFSSCPRTFSKWKKDRSIPRCSEC